MDVEGNSFPRRVCPRRTGNPRSAEVTVERLRSILETAVIDLESDDEGDLYLTGGIDFPIWVRVDHDRKTLELFTFIRKVATDAATVALRLNQMNSNFALGQFYHLDDAIYSRHGVSFDGGLLPRQFVKIGADPRTHERLIAMAKHFGRHFDQSLYGESP
jgi:hypothetical protein